MCVCERACERCVSVCLSRPRAHVCACLRESVRERQTGRQRQRDTSWASMSVPTFISQYTLTQVRL